MIKVDLQVAIALKKLQSPEFIPLIDALRQSLEASKSSLMFAENEPLIRMLQGEAQFINGFLKLVTDADAIVEKSKRTHP